MEQISEANPRRRGEASALSSSSWRQLWSWSWTTLDFLSARLQDKGSRRCQSGAGRAGGWEPAWASPAPDAQHGGPGGGPDSEGTLTSTDPNNKTGTRPQTPNCRSLDCKTRGGGGGGGARMSAAGFYQSLCIRETRTSSSCPPPPTDRLPPTLSYPVAAPGQPLLRQPAQLRMLNGRRSQRAGAQVLSAVTGARAPTASPPAVRQPRAVPCSPKDTEASP